MKQGVLIYDKEADRMDVRLGLEEYYGGLHCGTCMDVLVGNRWKSTRIEFCCFHQTINDGTGPGAFYSIMEQDVFSSYCIGAGDIFSDIVRYRAPPIQQVILHIWLLVFRVGHRFSLKCLRHFDGREMWKTGDFCWQLSGQNVVFSTYRRRSVKSRGSYSPCFPSSSVILWISHPLFFLAPQEEEKFSPFCTKVRSPSFWWDGLLWAGQSTGLPEASGIPDG